MQEEEQYAVLHEFVGPAKRNLSRQTWDYLMVGAETETTYIRNRVALDSLAFRPRVLRDVEKVDTSGKLLGQKLRIPAILAPIGSLQDIVAEGGLAPTQAAARFGIMHMLSSACSPGLEAVAAANDHPKIFQLYVRGDAAWVDDYVQRAVAHGYKALCLTVDAPLLGRRERDVKNRFALPAGLEIANLHAAGYARLPPARADSGLAAYVADLLDPALTWDAIDWLRSLTKLPVLVKGIVRADDARRAIAAGAAGVVVSNHGGRQLDAAPATIDVLARVVDAVAGGGEVLLDGGVRRGTDVIKALALGARAVLVGRPVLWGLAANGRPGVAAALAMLWRELDLAMALCGCADIASIGRDLVAPP